MIVDDLLDVGVQGDQFILQDLSPRRVVPALLIFSALIIVFLLQHTGTVQIQRLRPHEDLDLRIRNVGAQETEIELSGKLSDEQRFDITVSQDVVASLDLQSDRLERTFFLQ